MLPYHWPVTSHWSLRMCLNVQTVYAEPDTSAREGTAVLHINVQRTTGVQCESPLSQEINKAAGSDTASATCLFGSKTSVGSARFA